MEFTVQFIIKAFCISIFATLSQSNCQYERCCNISPCSAMYCTQRTSETWISSENYALYQYTKLVLANQQCIPCPYNCKTCQTDTTCQNCYDGFYKSEDGQCLLCSFKCKTCQVSNGIEKCSQCMDGTFLDDTSLSCKSCPLGAKSCSSSTAIIQCLPGYLKSSNSLFCTSCPDNCLSCPMSDSYCSSCEAGFYLSSGLCKQCIKDNCENCLGIGNTIYCTNCNDGFLLASGQCLSCPSNCKICSSTTICTQCNSGYYLQSGGCQAVTTSTQNCLVYQSSTSCSECVIGYYLNSDTKTCFPCSITCQSCYGIHFGRCTSCRSQANLFNQMCLVYPFPSSSKTRKYYSLPGSSSIFNGGVLQCSSQLYSGQSFSINLNNLSAYKITMKFKIYGETSGQSYSVSLNSNTQEFAITSIGYQLCNSTKLYIGIEQDVSFTEISLQNQLTFTSSSSSNLFISQIILEASKCNSLCIQCSEIKCFTCVNDKLFTQDAYCVYVCSKGYYTYKQNKECVKQCPQTTYLSLSIAQCLPCVSPCNNCLTDTYCLSCIQNNFLTSDNTCAQKCPYRYYGNVLTQICEQCVGRCLQCIDDEKCLSCKTGFLEGTSCVDQCSTSQQYQDLVTLKCQACQSPCLECQFYKDYCLSCVSGFYFLNNTCLIKCPDGYYFDNENNCLQCQYPCENCLGSQSNCSSCVDKYLLPGPPGTCHTQCPQGYYEDNIKLICQKCDEACTICFQVSNNCFQCADSYFLFGSKCVSNCPEQYYGENKLCSPCQGLCYTCSNQATCLSCESNFLQNGQCVRASQCNEGTFANIETLKCSECSSQCKTCSGTETSCTSCSDISKVLYQNLCIDSCPSDYFYINEGVCKVCQSPCVTCINQTHCLSCQTGYKYSSTTNMCSSTCAVGTYFDSSQNDCVQCAENCIVCENSKFCYLCADQYYLHVKQSSSNQNQCVNKCPQKYYANGLSCSACLFPCVTCQSSIDCLSCATGILYENRCLSGCPDSTYLSTDQCLPCGGNCLTCTNSATQCLSCKTGFYLMNSDCTDTCPDGSYAFEAIQQCYQCPTSCQTCLNSTYCLTCITGQTYLTSQNICSEQCPSGYFGDQSTQTCKLCSQKCQTCKSSADNCMTCSPSYLLVKISQYQSDCLVSCPTQYYQQNSICYSCVYPCKQCYNSIQCKTCISGMFYHKQSKGCLLNCPFGTFYHEVSDTLKECLQCVSPCNTCTNQTYCISCKNGLLLLQGKCVSQCPSQYYQDTSGNCNRCYGLCQTCSGKYFCLTCHSGYSYDGFCYSSCPPGTYADPTTKKCQPCKSPCLQCTGSASYCKRCQFNMFAYKGKCQQQCPKGTYQSGQECKGCQFPCIDCPSQFVCNECIGGYLLYMRTSCISNVEKCPNDLYKMNSKECVPITWCPESYYKDIEMKTCSTQCSRQKYITQQDKKCLNSCNSDEYVGQNMTCKNSVTEPPISLMNMSALTFIKSSIMHIIILLNENETWLENNEALYSVKNLDYSRRILNTAQQLQYLKYKQISQKQLALMITEMPSQCSITVPAHYLVSASTNYNLQTPTISIPLPQYMVYTYSQVYTGKLLGQFSQGLSWFIIIFTFFFLIVNRVSDVYILWDNAQFLYLLVFLNIQYPPNLNQFLLGMSNTHFLFIPSIFASLVSQERAISHPPFYAYAYDCNFLRTAGSPILLIIIAVVIFLILKLIEILGTKVEKIADKMKEFPRFKKKVFGWLLRFRWHHTSDVFFLTYDIIFLFAISQLVQIQHNPNNIGSNVTASIMLVVYIIFPIFVAYKLYKHYPNIQKGRMVRNLQCFFRGIEKNNKFGVSLILLRYFRKILYCILIGIFSMQPMFVLPILMFLSIIMVIFTFINKPYRKKLSNIINLLTEICLAIFFMLVAVIEFIDSDKEINFIFGWIACGFLSVMLFALIFQVFCKTLFYLQPQVKQKKKDTNDKLDEKLLSDEKLKGKFSEEYLRRKAGQFFNHLFPQVREQWGGESDDELMEEYQDGDSENSQNNMERQRKWGFDDEESQRKSDEFRHYGESDQSQSAQKTRANNQDKKAPQYLIRCVKEL